MRRLSVVFWVAAWTLILSGWSQAARADGTNLVVNGGFETGNLTGWIEGGNNPSKCDPAVYVSGLNLNTGFCNNFINPYPTNSGTYAAFFPYAASLGTGTLSQNLSTTPGVTYTLTFSIDTFLSNFPSPGGTTTPNQFIVDWGGQQVLDLVNINTNNSYVQYSLNLTATGSSTTLEFLGTNDPSATGLDDVSVVATPEPSGVTLLCTGLLVLLGLKVKRIVA